MAVETRWNSWQIPKDVEQEVSYMIGLFSRAKSMEEKCKLDREIQDLIIWAANENRPEHAPPRPGTRVLSRKEAILAQRERRG